MRLGWNQKPLISTCYLRMLGHEARAHSASCSDVDLARLALAAGLTLPDGENPYVGQRYALAAVSTTLALAPDQALHPQQNRWQSHGPAWWLGQGTLKGAFHRDAFAQREFRQGAHPFETLKRRDTPTTFIDHDRVPRFLQYTGGTTGVAKGAVLTHGNMVANLQQLSEWIAHDLKDGEEILICPLPLYHVYALTSSLVFMKIGANNVLITNPRDLPAFIHDMKKYRFSAIIGVNTLYRALLETPEFAQVDTTHLKVSSAGGMAVQRVVADRWRQATGVPIIEGYGLTETAPVVISNPLNIAEWTGMIGLPIPSTLATVLDDNDRELPLGEVGEICVKGPQVMPRYWNRPDETAKVFTPDGWFRTGDMGYVDERGFFKITDRKKDMIVVSGFKVFPNQVEDAVALHSGVLEVAAVGVPEERSGELVKIVVVRKDPALTEQALLAHCRQHLTDYKVPKLVEFRDEPLPKTNLGKILRRELRTTPTTSTPSTASNAAATPAAATT